MFHSANRIQANRDPNKTWIFNTHTHKFEFTIVNKAQVSSPSHVWSGCVCVAAFTIFIYLLMYHVSKQWARSSRIFRIRLRIYIEERSFLVLFIFLQKPLCGENCVCDRWCSAGILSAAAPYIFVFRWSKYFYFFISYMVERVPCRCQLYICELFQCAPPTTYWFPKL